MYRAFYLSVPVYLFLQLKQSVHALLNGEPSKLPLDDMGKPHECPDIIEQYRSEGFLASYDLEACFLKQPLLNRQFKIRERLRQVRKHHLYKVPVVL